MARKARKRWWGDGRVGSKVDQTYDDFYYIIHIYRSLPLNKLRVVVIRKHFKFKRRAKMMLEKTVSRRELLNFEIMKGSEVKAYGLRFGKSIYTNKITRHDYPVERMTKQEKKSFRTKSRRWKKLWKKDCLSHIG